MGIVDATQEGAGGFPCKVIVTMVHLRNVGSVTGVLFPVSGVRYGLCIVRFFPTRRCCCYPSRRLFLIYYGYSIHYCDRYSSAYDRYSACSAALLLWHYGQGIVAMLLLSDGSG
jgi:hypothetical protein